MTMFRSAFARITPLVLLGFAVGCGSTDSPLGPSPGSKPEVVSFQASPNPADFGSVISLSWKTVNAKSVVVSDGSEVLFTSTSDPNGLYEVVASKDTTFTLTAITGTLEESATVEVLVKPVILDLHAGTDGEAVIGKPLVINWKTGGAEEVILSTSEGFSHEAPQGSRAQGWAEAPVPADGVFTLTARSGDFEAVETVNVLAIELDPPTIDAFEASRTTVTKGEPTPANVSWVVSGATKLSLLVNREPVDLGDRSIEVGSFDLTVDGTTELILKAENLAGDVIKTLKIQGIDLPGIVSLGALPSRVLAGEEFSIHWTTKDAVAVELERDGVLVDGVSDPVGSLSSETIAVDTEYLLRAFNEAGSAVEKTLVVAIGLPEIASFGPERSNVAPSVPATFHWQVDGGVEVSVLDPEGSAIEDCSSIDLAQVHAGSCTITSPAELGAHVYELVIRNASNDEVRAQATLKVVDGPTIDLFATSEDAVDTGEVFTLSWATGSDPSGKKPNLNLRDDQGGEYPIAGDDVYEGSMELSFEEAGTYVFTLTAATSGTTPAEESLTVTVYPVPAVSLTASTDLYDPAEEEFFTLSWSSENASSLTIWELDEDGEAIEPALFEATTEEEMTSGSLEVDPGHDISYVAVATNERGTVAESRVDVEVLGPEILTLVADPPEVVEGQSTILRWTTTRTNSVFLDFDTGLTSAEGTEALIPLSDAAQAIEWEGDSCNLPSGVDTTSACPIFTFPDGFIFRYDGQPYDRAKIFVDGVLSFDLNKDYSGGVGSNLELPVAPDGIANTTGWNEILAPFWMNLRLRPDLDENTGLYYELGTDPEKGRYLIVHWRAVSEFGGGKITCNNSLAFQVILWEASGAFEYRYENDAPTTLGSCHGSLASIGYQVNGGTQGGQTSFRAAIPGGISGKSFHFNPSVLSVNGELELAVPETRTFTLTAIGARGHEVTKSIEVIAHHPPEIGKITVDPTARTDRNTRQPIFEMNAGDDVIVSWETFGASSVYVRGPDGTIVCPAEENTVPTGGCAFTGTASSLQTYSVVAVGALGYEVNSDFQGTFFEPLRINSISATPSSLRADDLGLVQLSWTAEGASGVTVYANDVPQVTGGRVNPNGGTVNHSPERTTTYRVEVSHADGRTASSKPITVQVRTFEEPALTQTETVSDGSKQVTIGWDAPPLTGGHVHVIMEPVTFAMEEVFDSPFIDISSSGAMIPGTLTDDGVNSAPIAELTEFPEGFTFPFFGKVFEGIYPATTGYIGMYRDGSNNVPQPLLEHQVAPVNIAPFWDWIRSYGKGRLYTDYIPHASDPSQDQFIVQWNEMQLQQSPVPPTGADAHDDLTFQAALFRDGSIEFRYKTMYSEHNPDRAKATNASIGFREDLRSAEKPDAFFRGYQLFYKVSNPVPLDGRTYRYQARKPTDFLTDTPTETTEYKICFELDGFRECQMVAVVVPDVGNLLITELAVNPHEGATQWFEVRNTTPHPFDVRGLKLVSNVGEHTIGGEDPLVVESGGFLIFAASDDPFLAPDYVYGSSLALGTGVDSLRIMNGTREVARADWDESWTIPKGKSLSLDGNFQRPGILSYDFSKWCEDTEEGSPRSTWSCSSSYYDLDAFSQLPFIDISTTGTEIGGLHEASTASVLPGGIGFDFPFFGDSSDRLWISSNGFVAVSGAPDPMPTPEEIPFLGGSGPGIIAPLWTHLGKSGKVLYERMVIDGQQVLVIQWDKKVRFLTGQASFPGNTTFQTQLWENGDIVHAYGRMSAINFPQPGDTNPQKEHLGGIGTVGIEAIGSGEGIQYLHKEPILYEGLTIHFVRK